MSQLTPTSSRTLVPSLRRALVLGTLLMICAGIASAQLPIPPSTQFDMTGFLQEATVSGGGATAGGTLKVNGHTVIVPANTIVILPATALSWQELFSQAPAPYTGRATGMAAADVPPPMTTYEVQVVGNRVITPTSDSYIAGLIYVSQQGLNSGAGYINFIDYRLGEMRVGGIINDPTCAQGGGPNTCSGARVRLNDPSGRYGRNTTSPDVRFTVDPDNPTITAGSGYPMCFPRTDPSGLTPDALCPQTNRPQFVAGAGLITYMPAFTTVNATNPNFPIGVAGGTVQGDSHFQVPFEIGDYVTYAGTLVNDTATPTALPAGGWPGTVNTYIAAHTVEDNIGVWTFPGSDPAYLRTDVFLMGTGGLSVLGVGEAVIRTRFEGMTTDVADPVIAPGSIQRNIHLYGIDTAPNGAISDRDWGTIGVDQGAPLGAVKGRWRFRPPCLPAGSVPAKPDKQCVMNAADTFLPAPREMRAVIEGLQGQAAATALNPVPAANTSANGLVFGQYHAPILEFIFPENVPGTPIVENNFNTMPFLGCGGYISALGTLGGVLNPWPSNVPPVACAGQCTAATPTITSSSSSAAAGTKVTLTAASGGTGPITLTIAQDASDVPQVQLTVVGNTATFTAPGVAQTTPLKFTVTATNCAGSVTASVTVTINGAAAPTVSATPAAPLTVQSGLAFGPFTASCTDPANLLPCTFKWTQTNAGAVGVPTILNPNPTPSASIGPFTVNLAPGAAPVTIQLQIIATNSAGVQSAPEFTSVTVNPVPDQITITTSVYRFGKQRLDLTVTDSVASPNVVLTLAPYRCQSGVTLQCPNGFFDPATLGNVLTNTGNGNYTYTLVGGPEPACNAPLPGGNINAPCTQAPLVVNSNIGGSSGLNALQKTRQ
jgi:hypothetical protein